MITNLTNNLSLVISKATSTCQIDARELLNYAPKYSRMIFILLSIGIVLFLISNYTKDETWTTILHMASFMFLGVGIYQMIPLTFTLTAQGTQTLETITWIAAIIAALSVFLRILLRNKKVFKHKKKSP